MKLTWVVGNGINLGGIRERKITQSKYMTIFLNFKNKRVKNNMKTIQK